MCSSDIVFFGQTQEHLKRSINPIGIGTLVYERFKR